MKKQRGITTGWILAIVVSLIALAWAVQAGIKAWDSYTTGLVKQGHEAGVSETKADYAQRDNAALVVANARIRVLEGEARARERADAKENARILAQRETDRRNYEAQLAADAAAIAAGTLVLRDPAKGATPASTGQGNRSGTGQAVGTASGSDAGSGAYLSPEATRFLFALTAEADDVAKQLASAQDRIRQDLLTCNATPPPRSQ